MAARTFPGTATTQPAGALDAFRAFRMPDLPRLVPGPIQDPALTSTVEVVAGELHINQVRCCPWCFEDLGSVWCCCNPAAETAIAELGKWRAGR